MEKEPLREKLYLMLEGELDELYSDIFLRELEEVLEETNVFDFLFFNDSLPDNQKVDDLMKSLSQCDSERVEKLVSRLILTSKALPLLDDKRYVEDIWLAVGEDEIETTERILDFTFPADFKWFYSNFMSIRTEGFDLFGFSSSCVEVVGDEHPIVSANRIYKESNEICFGISEKGKYFIDEAGITFLEQNGFLEKVGMGFLNLMIVVLEKRG